MSDRFTSDRVIGREKVIELIDGEVRGARLVSVVGAGGIGKTTVALAVAELAVESFRDGVWFVDIAPVREGTLVPNAIAAAIGLVVHSADIMTALCRFLRDRQTLLLLDNCEHLIEAVVPCVTRLLEASSVHVLATSRVPLRIAGERAHRLPGLESPPVSSELTAAEALAFPAIELFVARATDRLESFTLTDADVPFVANICRSLDGIALAIELAAMRVDVFGVRGLQRQLEERLQILGERRAGLERHRTLTATLDWSYSLLPPDEAAVLRAVSVFAGVLRLEDARAIANRSPDDTARILTELAAQSLLSVDESATEAVYRPLETTRAYCLEKLRAGDEESAVQRRHAEYICDVVERAATEVATLPAQEWGTRYGRYLDDLRCALTWANTAGRPTLLVRLTAAGTALWNHFSLTSESRTHLERAIAQLRETETDSGVEMNLQLTLAGAILYTQGIVPAAREAMERAREIAIQRNDAVYHLNCLRMIGTYQLFSGQNDTGIQTLEAFVAMAIERDPAAVAEGETHLGCGELFIGRLADARQRLERLYAHGLQDLNDGTALRFLYNNSINIMVVLSHVQWLTGAPAAAARTATMVVEYGLAAHHELSLSIGLAWVCLVNFWTGSDEECTRHAAMLDDLVERHGIVTWRPVASFCRGALASMHEATLSAGIADLKRTVAECREIGHMARLPYYMSVLAEALVKRGRLGEAEATIDEALALATKWNDNWSLPEMLRIHAFVLAAKGIVQQQETTLVAAMALAEKHGALSWRLRAGIDLARLWRTRARTNEAKQMLRPILDAFTEGFETRDVAIATKLLAELE
ncbi:Transcriptional regulator, LuxR family protein [Minicystis rosea]|nr:Transcriptional regulator, LuxR family protein [Minicystis rosea]